MTRTTPALLSIFMMTASIVAGQQTAAAPATGSGPAWSPAKDLGVFVFGKNNQTPEQQLKDEADCYVAARDQSGIDPKAPPPDLKSAEQKAAEQKAAADAASAGKGARVGGAAKGAAAGAAIGAITGDAGTGAAAGAVGGTMVGGAQKRRANKAAKQQAAAQTAAQQEQQEAELKRQHAEGIDRFQRAFGACLDARSYSVK